MSSRLSSSSSPNRSKGDQEISSSSVPGNSRNGNHHHHQSTDDPSQLTEGSHASSRKSAYSYDNLKNVVRQASEILQGRLPSSTHDSERELAPWNNTIVEVPEDSYIDPNHARSRGEVESTTERAVSDPLLINFLEDKPSEMTWSRRIALALMDKAWYNPAAKPPTESSSQPGAAGDDDADLTNHSEGNISTLSEKVRKAGRHLDAYPFTVSKRETPSLAKAWAYFEHVALPRYLLKPKQDETKKNLFTRMIRRVFCKGNQQLSRAEPGELEKPSKLYQPIFTPHNQLGDWGLGIGLYFSTLRAITVLTFLAGLLNIPNIRYFLSDEYSEGQGGIDQMLTKGSAICTNTIFVPCEDCPINNRDLFAEKRVFLDVIHNETGIAMNFTMKNLCDGATLEQGFINYATLVLVIIGISCFSNYLRRMEVKFDEDEQTAQDYSIVIQNPPGDATNAEEWREFFYNNFDGADATAITIAVDNDLLVKSLVERREVLRKIEMMVEPGTSLDTLNLAGIAAKEERARRFFGRLLAGVSPGVPELFARLVVLTSKVQGLSQQDYPASNVFVTFETEKDQRRVLEALSVGSLAVSRNKKTAVKNPAHLFRGEHVLSIREPDEPNTVRWQDLNEKFKERAKQQLLTTICTFGAIITIAFIVRVCNNASAAWSAIAISLFNSIFPMFAKFLCHFEAHSSETGKQRSLYFKIALFRWVNTAIVITIITPFTSTLSTGEDDGLITKIYAIFFAEIVTTNAIQLADPAGHFQRHFLAPRSNTQDAMNLNMSGQEFELAERYTNMTKILFLAVWYCAIYPATLFLCSFTLLVNYFTDRFSLMRTWKRPPALGSEISQFSRTYFFTLAILAMAIMSSYYWAGFPFDNLCPTGEEVPANWTGTWVFERPTVNVTGLFGPTPVILEEEPILFNVSAGDERYKYCLQDFFRYGHENRSFPFTASKQSEGSEWMSEDQEIITNVYGWTVVAIMSLTMLSFFYSWWQSLLGLFHGSYEARGDDMGIAFSEVDSRSTYIPQVNSPVYAYPLLACNVDAIDRDLLDWTDPDKPFSFYDLTKDAEVLLKGIDVSNKVVFSQVVNWPPRNKASNGSKKPNYAAERLTL